LTNEVSGETRTASIEADDLDAAFDLASMMRADLVRNTGIPWFVTVS
jgi:hypothetical protein